MKFRAKKKLLPEDVLEGRVKVDPLDLYRLIHQVNPTHRRLSLHEARRRYDQKHRLQSFLVLHFGEEHVVVSRAEQEGVVSLDHPSGIFDACHAPLADLEPEARSWIQRQLDMAGGGEDEVLRLRGSDGGGGGGGAEASEDLLAAARRSLAEFDYTNAEQLLTKAMDTRQGGVPAVVLLLELLVETLGLDEEALALRPRFGEAALGNFDVRSLLALAAARHGDRELAEKWVSGLGDPGVEASRKRRTAAHAALATEAVRAGDEAAARRWLDELAAGDPFHEAIAAVRAGLENLARAGMGQAEAELSELYDEGGCLEAAAAARTLADRWPASELARRILREAGELRRQTAIAEHLETADQALAGEDFELAVRHYEAVLAEDADIPDIPRRLEEARRHARQRAEASAVGGALRCFAEADPRRALLAYLELPPALRGRLRSRLQDQDQLQDLDDLDLVESAHPRLKAAVVVDAILALRESERLFAEGQTDKSCHVMEPHWRLLTVLPRLSDLQKELVRRLMEARAKRNYELIRQVEAAMKEDVSDLDPEKNLALLDEIDLNLLSPEYRQWVEGARSSLHRSMEFHSLTEAYSSELKAGHLFAARQKGRRFKELAADLVPKAELKTWKFPGQFLDDEIKRTWQLKHESWPGGKALGSYPGLLQPRPVGGPRSESRGLDDEGRRLVVAQAFVDWLFLRIIDVRSGKVLERLSMNTPRPLGAPLTTCWDGDVIQISGGEGGFVVLELEGWKIAEWEWLPRHLGKGQVERSVVLPRSPYVWVFSRRRGDAFSKVEILERDAWRVMRKRTQVMAVSVLYGPDPDPRILMSGKTGTYVCTASGHRDPDEPLVDRCALAATADATGIVALLSPAEAEAEGDGDGDGKYKDAGLGLARFEHDDDGWRLAREVRVASARAKGPTEIVSAQAVVWVLFTATDGEARLIAVESETLELLYSLPMPHAAALVGDRHGRHAVLLLDGDEGPEVIVLGRHEPRPRWKWRPLAERRLPIVDLHVSCMGGAFELLGTAEKYDDLSPSELRRMVLKMARESTADNLKSMILQAYILHDRDGELVKKFLSELAQRHPENLDVCFLLAEWSCRLASVTETKEDWKQGLEMVLGIDPAWMTVYRRHFHHVQGVAHMLVGELEKACEAFEAGLEHQDAGCNLEPLLELAKPMEGEPPPVSEWDAKHPLTRQLVGALRTSVEAFRRDDDKGVVAVLEHPAVWLAAETETLTRLAIAHIALAGDPEEAGFEARLALSYLLEVIKVEAPRRVPSADLTAAKKNLSDTGEMVREWLGIVATVEAKHRKKAG